MEPSKITLGKQEFSVPKPLTFGQLRVIEPLTSGIFAEVKAKGRFSVECYDSIATIIITAVGIANLDAQKLNAMPLTSAEFYEAFKTICDASCMFAKPDPGASQGGSKCVDWGYIYADLRASLGYSTDEIDALTAPEYAELADYWLDYPPVHKLVAAFVGHKPRKKPEQKENDLAELMAMFPGGQIR